MREEALLRLVEAMPERMVRGTRTLHDLVYFLQRRGVPLGFRWGLLLYGPYSRDLSEFVCGMEMAALLQAECVSGRTDFSLGPGSRYVPRELDGPVSAAIHFVVGHLAVALPFDLEFLATVDFLATHAATLSAQFERLTARWPRDAENTMSPALVGHAVQHLVDLAFLDPAWVRPPQRLHEVAAPFSAEDLAAWYSTYIAPGATPPQRAPQP